MLVLVKATNSLFRETKEPHVAPELQGQTPDLCDKNSYNFSPITVTVNKVWTKISTSS